VHLYIVASIIWFFNVHWQYGGKELHCIGNAKTKKMSGAKTKGLEWAGNAGLGQTGIDIGGHE
jgi:hypothetical protein